LEQWLAASANNRDYFAQMKKTWMLAGMAFDTDAEEAYLAFLSRKQQAERLTPKPLQWFKNPASGLPNAERRKPKPLQWFKHPASGSPNAERRKPKPLQWFKNPASGSPNAERRNPKPLQWFKNPASGSPNAERRTRKLFVALAAAASIALAITFAHYFHQQPVTDSLTEFANHNTVTPAPGTEVQVVFADKSCYKAQDKEVELKYSENKSVTINDKEEITQRKPEEQTAYNQVIVPHGKRSSITFADGTKMWLNAGSRAVYPVEFAADRREVFVEGEAYFDVAKDRQRPFVVKTGALEVKVLGTSFNVNACPEDENIDITLVSGSVEVSSDGKQTPLQPDRQLTFNRKTHQSKIREVETDDYVCWKYGFIKLNGEKLSSVLHRLEKYYAVKIISESNLDGFIINGKLDMRDNIDDVLKIISEMAPIHYNINENTIIMLLNQN
ncbi:MAG: FecR domain-containing protein, partial [Tannerella sp.]|nr:FecR domain-containing protein [Tannerella sp.]